MESAEIHPARADSRCGGAPLRWIAAIGLLAATAVGCSHNEVTAAVEPSAADRVRRGAFQDTLLLTGEIESVRADKIIVPQTPVWQVPIRWIEEDGAAVLEGQKVLELDNTQFTGDLEQKQLAEAKAINDLARKEADLAGTIAEKEFALERSRVTVEKARLEAEIPESLRPKREHEEMQLALIRAETDWRKAQEDLEGTLRASEAEMEELRIALDRAQTEIRVAETAVAALTLNAPRDGIIVVAENWQQGRKFQVGDDVFVGLAVMLMPDLSAMKVVAGLSDVDDGRIVPGMSARCTLDAYPDRAYMGAVREVSPIAKEESGASQRRFFRVEILLDETDPELMRPGMSVRAEILGPTREDVLLAPRQALDLAADPPRAFLADGSVAEIRLGMCNAIDCIVEHGLAADDRLRSGG